MIALIALALATPVAADNRIDPIDTFRKVCMEGEARFSKGSVNEVPLQRVPWNFQAYVQGEGFERYFLSEDRKTLIALTKLKEDGQMCAVLTVSVDKRRIYELGFPKVGLNNRPPLFDQRDIERSIESSLGYQIFANRYGRAGLLLTSYILSPEEKRKLDAEMKAAKKPVDRVSNGSYRRTRSLEPK